jgi:phytoene dehydrogenase-like protein
VRSRRDAIVVGAGPNGLAAAITLAERGRSVLVLERAATVGGGARSAELTLPGYVHDVCSAIHPLAAGSPFLRRLPLADHGLELVHPEAPLAHPLDGGEAVMLERSLDATAEGLGGADGDAYRRLMGPFLRGSDRLLPALLGPLRPAADPLGLARFGLAGLRSAAALARGRFGGERARALLAGSAAHSMLALDAPASAAPGLVLNVLGHAAGWPLARGGSQRIADALAGHLESLGGEIRTGTPVDTLEELPPARAVLLDLTPRQVLQVAGHRLPRRYRRALRRFRRGPGVFKLDWALSGPVPWSADGCHRAATAHLGGTLDEIAASEREVARGRLPERPFVLLAQQTPWDPGRAPPGRHTAWAYCHVPNGSAADMTEAIERQVERFAPGFRDLVLARAAAPPAEVERRNPNNAGGDIGGGAQDLRQLLTRPAIRPVPYATPARGLFVCSSSTPPGPGVHGACGHFAALAALRRGL